MSEIEDDKCAIPFCKKKAEGHNLSVPTTKTTGPRMIIKYYCTHAHRRRAFIGMMKNGK